MNKICIIAKSLDLNGITSVIMNYSILLSKDYDITIMAGLPIDENISKKCVMNNINLIRLPPKRKKISFLNYYKNIYIFLKKEKYDVVHVHGNSSLISIELFLAFINGVKVRIAHSHNTKCDFPFIHMILKPILNVLSTNRIACGNDAGKWMFGKRKFIVLPNGIDVKKFFYNPNIRKSIRKKRKFTNKNIVIGHVGVFNEQKNHNFLVEVFNDIYIKNNNYILWLIGEGEKLNEIKTKVSMMECKDNVIFEGKSNKINDLYNAMDLFVLPSLFEGLPVVLIEAQTNGLKCLVSDVIDKKVCFTDNFSFYSINNKIEWIRAIENIDDFEHNNFIKNDKYDIEQNVLILNQIYKGEKNVYKNL